MFRQVKEEAPRGGNPQPAHGKLRPTPGAEAPGWASSLSGRARLVLRARPLGFVVLLLCAGGGASRLGLTLNLTASLPRGVYQRVDPALQRGSLVLVCLPASWAALARERGYLARGRVLAQPRPEAGPGSHSGQAVDAQGHPSAEPEDPPTQGCGEVRLARLPVTVGPRAGRSGRHREEGRLAG